MPRAALSSSALARATCPSIALLVFGPKKLPELGKGIGEGIRGFKAAMKEEEKPASTTTAVASDQKLIKE